MASRPIVAPSILSADFAHLAGEIAKVEEGGAELLHLDIMDGRFVPNITIGPPVVASIRRFTKLPLDAHLMIEEPARYVDELIHAGVNWMSVHAEADVHLNRTIQHIRSQGVKAGVAINPATPISALEEILPEVDYVLVMSVNPGFGGQRFIPTTLNKLRKLRQAVTSNNYRARIEVDGGVDSHNLQNVLEAGADVIVAGFAVFGGPASPSESLRELNAITDRYVTNLGKS